MELPSLTRHSQEQGIKYHGLSVARHLYTFTDIIIYDGIKTKVDRTPTDC